MVKNDGYRKENAAQERMTVKPVFMALAVLSSVIFLSGIVFAPVFTGTIEGYVFYMNGSGVIGASVTATVAGCSGGAPNGCTGSTSTDANHYYVIANLNLPPNGSITASATKGLASGSVTDNADQFQAAYINITLCGPPSSPLLVAVPDRSVTWANFSWTSGIDPFGYGTVDDFQLDASIVYNATSPRSATGLSFATHTWQVKTCNLYPNGTRGCCSSWATDSFDVTCAAPSAPTLVAVADRSVTWANFSWTSGIDPNGYPTFNTFQLDSNPVVNNATSPRSATGLSFSTHTWQVKTCNIIDNATGCCSSYSTDSFDVTCAAPSAPTQTLVPDGHNTSANFVWVSGADPNAYPTFDVFQLDANPVVNNATSPRNATNLTWGAHAWRVRTCNVIDNATGCCSAYSEDPFNVVNNPPSSPNITDEAPTESTTVTFEWISGIDPDNDTTTDQFQFSNVSDFSSLTVNTTTISPYTVIGLAALKTYYWRVRTCDVFGACSAWVSDDFFVYSCPACPVCPTPGPGGGGGGGGGGAYCPTVPCQNECTLEDRACRGGNARLVCGNFDNDSCLEMKAIKCDKDMLCLDGQCTPCIERWECTEWGACSNRKQVRNCRDLNSCGSTVNKPTDQKDCELLAAPVIEVPMPLLPWFLKILQPGEIQYPTIELPFPWWIFFIIAFIMLAFVIVEIIRRKKRKGTWQVMAIEEKKV